ncbi:MAG TPA: putative LPS assembly protein LptD [Flavipsychrobacter sp.]|nr:putative LPS assembly protein LptD [Flavipsychrobacter sp.]
MHCLPYMLTVFFIFALTTNSVAQTRIGKDATSVAVNDSLALSIDSLSATNTSDSVTISNLEDSLGIKISPDALTSPVTATATDSAVLDMKNNLFYLYGDAQVNYEDLKLNAGQITFDQSTNTVIAQPAFDTSGGILKRPTFTQRQETVSYDSLQYNFKSKRAIIRNARSQYGEGFVYSQQVKRNPDESIFGWRNVYTTCALDTPHFGIRANKIKVVPNKVIASASANIVIEQVPTPVFLPFGLFPITQRQRSGFQMPSYTFEQQRGLGLTNGGYYFHLNDYVDFLFMANIFTKGSYSVSGISNYSNRYRYNGGLSFSYAYNKTGESYEPGASTTKDFMVNWRHQQDPKARPGTNFSASVMAGTSSFYSNNSYNVNQILNNQFTSNISYSKNWQNKPYSLSVAARHSQNTQTRLVDVSLPELNFYVAQFNPFENKKRVGSPKWYEKISAQYNFNAVNQISFYDTAFSLNTLSLGDFRNGFKHSIPINASYNVLRFINLSFGTTYTEYWLTNKTYRFYNANEGKIDTVGNRGFFTARDFNATAQLSTRIYGLKMFKRGKLMGIRHVLTPNVGFNYTPDFAAAPFRYYYQTRLDTSGNLAYLSPFETSVIGVPGMGQYGDFSSSINFGINNNLQIKTRSRKDTTGNGRNVTLIDGFSITSAYNIAADSFNWSTFNMNFRTNILEKFNVSANAVFDPYATDYETGRRLPRTMWQEGTGIANLRNANIALSANFRSKQKDKSANPAVRTDEYSQLMQNGGYNDYVDFDIPWSLNVAYSLGIDKRYTAFSKRDTIRLTQSLLFSGDFNVTSRWKMTFSSGYDFETKQLTLTSIDIYRDLHCWEMRLGTIPFGPRKSYNFTLSVKASILQDLKLVRRRDFRDAVNF